MSGQALDLRRSAQIVRRYRILVGSIAALGLLLGAGYAMVNPPMLTSNALVVLPVSNHEVATQVVIAASDPVLSRALPNAVPAMSLDTLRSRVFVSSLTGNILSISAQGRTAAQAQRTTNAVANSYISYVGSPISAIGRVQARLVASATDATGSSALTNLVTFALIGALAGAVVGALTALARGRGDRRLWVRDRIADTVGVPVVASVSAGRPADPAGWTKLLAEYEPGVIHAWGLRRALNQLGLVDLDLNGPGGESSSVTVVSLASDRKALAIGPQLAAFAASLGIHVTLVVGPQQDENAAASLRAACATLSAQPSGRSGHLRVTADDHQRLDRQPGTLAVVVATVDGQAPRIDGTMRTAGTVLAVSAGVATAEQLARVSVSAAADGRGIAGIIVADPDPADHTTGRLPQPAGQAAAADPLYRHDDGDPTVKDKDRQVLPSLNGGSELPDGLWLYDDFTPDDDQPATDFAAGLTSLGFIGAALRRSVWLWCLTAIVGLVGGAAVSVISPPAYQASTSILLIHNPNGNPVDEMQTDLTVAHNAAVAKRAMQKLGIQGNADGFLATYTVMNQTDRVLLITVSAPSSSAAVLRASAIATAFLQFRADQLQTQDQLTVSDLQQQISQARKQISALTAQISALSAQPGTESTRHQLTTQRNDATAALAVLQQTTNGIQASNQADVAAETKGSQVLDPATAIHHSAMKYILMYAVMGLIVGLALGVAILVIRALVSDRLRRRDDIADALGASVNLSVSKVDASRWRPRMSAAQDGDMRRIVIHLRDALPESSANAAALAVVAVDNDKTAARSLVSLAISCAQDGQNVLVADLCRGAPAAHLLGAGNPGFEAVTVDGARVAVAVPSPDDVTPTGPVRPGRMRVPDARTDGELSAAYGSADVLLTLIDLDPSTGAEHLRTWAADAVVMVTAGRSSWMRIHAVGEMIRLSRTPLVSAILIGADTSDESLGLTLAAKRASQAARFSGS